jgi:peptidoglycan/xylan/chitin deacetylase (PgdA/CDA1 family)
MSTDTAMTTVTLGFDDGTAGHFDVVRPALAQYGMPGVFFPITGRLGQPGYMTAEQVQQLHTEGHEIGGHTVHHLHLRDLSMAEAVEEIGQDRDALQALGVEPTSFAYPFGEWDDETAGLVEGAGYRSARIVGGISSSGLASPLPVAVALPIPDSQRFALPTPGSVRRHHTAADLQRLVEAAEDVCGHLQLVFHHIDLETPVYGFAPEEFEAFLRWLAPRALTHDTVVRRTRDVIAGPVPALLPGPSR